MMEITRKSRVLEVLKEFPSLEETVIGLAPPFKNLRNPILRRTVAQMATLEMVAKIGGLDVVDLVNTLRRAAGQGEIAGGEALRTESMSGTTVTDPDWTRGEPAHYVDGIEMLRRGDVPLNHINDLLRELRDGAFILLVTDFEPTPLLEAMRKQRCTVHHKVHPEHAGHHLTYITRRTG